MAKHDKKQAEAGVAWLIGSQNATYRQAATKFNVPVNALRARVTYRYGTLAEARTRASARAPHKKKWARPCLCCGDTELRPYGIYRCNSCRDRLSASHDGAV